jgi:hypothetical protein
MPSHETVYLAMNTRPGVADEIARARTESAHGLADAVIEIAYSSDDPAKANLLRNRCDQHRWLAGKYNSMYADKHMVEHRQHADTSTLGYEELMALAMAKAPHLTIEHDDAPLTDDATNATDC